MAYAAVVSLMQILQQIGDPSRYVRHSKLQIQTLQEKVSSLHDFLEKSCVYTDKVVKDLETKIRDIAYRAEDIIESHVTNFILYKRKYRNSRYRCFCKNLNRVTKEMHSIQQEAVKVKSTLDLIYVQQKNHLPIKVPRLTFSNKRPHMVGLDEDTMKVKEWLTNLSSKLEVISIVGMGGIGKTTFARNLFDDPLIVYQFDIRMWVTVSHDYQMHKIFAGLLDELSPDMRNASGEELAECLYKSLKGRKYIVVMDDVWDTKVWDDVKRFFPNDNNGSRIVLTSRITNVGVHTATSDHLHDMSFLSSSESWKLFCQIVFRGECCPPSLMGIGREIVKKCEGLPLPIVVIGGLLSMDRISSYWEKIATTLNSILATNGGLCSKILSLSYNHLPAHLKPCFLYFAIFPEDYGIQKSKIIKLWIAEGFIKPHESKRLEDIAEEYLQDLLNRSLLMVLKMGHDGKIKTYRIHDILRDFCITQGQEEKFLHVIDRYSPSHDEGITSERRVCIQFSTPLVSSEYISNTKGHPLPTRTLVLYREYADIIISDRSFGMVRVLEMGYGDMIGKFPMEVIRLVHLRYLSLNLERLESIPASIFSIWGLQTLVIDALIKGVRFCELPLEVWKMQHLRHLKIRFSCQLPDPPKCGVESENFVILAHLQTLSKMRNFRFTDEIVKRIPKLKKLRVTYDRGTEDWSQFHVCNIVCLNELETLDIASLSDIAFPPNLKFPGSLRKLTLSCCFGLRWEVLSNVAGSLPNLEVLKLDGACEGEVWEPNDGEFCELKFLHLDLLDLVHWRADDSHFPNLKCLKISCCPELEEIPIEIGNIHTLEMIELEYLSPSVVASARLILDEQKSFGNDVLQVRIKEN